MSSLATLKNDRDINIKVLSTYRINFYVETLKMLSLMTRLQYKSFSHLIQINSATDAYDKKIPE